MNTITEITRRAIFDEISVGTCWAGRFPEDEFLARLYDLNSLPSDDERYETAAEDIWQHRVNNFDWNDSWVFTDLRFDLLHGSDSKFLRFLCETVHPVVRPNSEEARRLVERFNDHLRKDGWTLVEQRQISGRPVFTAQSLTDQVEIFEEPTGWPKVDRQIGEIRLRLFEAVTEERCQAVGHLCREALISLAQAVYVREKHPPLDNVEPSRTDAKRMLEAYIAVEFAGGVNATARKHAKAAFDLANELQHDRIATFRDAAFCAEATASVVRLAAIISGRRGKIDLS